MVGSCATAEAASVKSADATAARRRNIGSPPENCGFRIVDCGMTLQVKSAIRNPQSTMPLGDRSDRQLPNAFAREREDRVADRRPDGRRARLADAARRFGAR